jgi:hypothetical protein
MKVVRFIALMATVYLAAACGTQDENANRQEEHTKISTHVSEEKNPHVVVMPGAFVRILMFCTNIELPKSLDSPKAFRIWAKNEHNQIAMPTEKPWRDILDSSKQATALYPVYLPSGQKMITLGLQLQVLLNDGRIRTYTPENGQLSREFSDPLYLGLLSSGPFFGTPEKISLKDADTGNAMKIEVIFCNKEP